MVLRVLLWSSLLLGCGGKAIVDPIGAGGAGGAGHDDDDELPLCARACASLQRREAAPDGCERRCEDVACPQLHGDWLDCSLDAGGLCGLAPADVCGAALDDFLRCSSSPSAQSCQASADGVCSCSAQLDDSDDATTLQTVCQPDRACRCYRDGVVVGSCLAEEDRSCDVFTGCCSGPFFAAP